MLAVKAIITGRVQGVWYRSWTVENAQTLALDGWVRNRSDGSVEACFCGPAPMVQEMLSRCQKGPIAARVLSVQDEPTEPISEVGFKQLPTV